MNGEILFVTSCYPSDSPARSTTVRVFVNFLVKCHGLMLQSIYSLSSASIVLYTFRLLSVNWAVSGHKSCRAETHAWYVVKQYPKCRFILQVRYGSKAYICEPTKELNCKRNVYCFPFYLNLSVKFYTHKKLLRFRIPADVFLWIRSGPVLDILNFGYN